MKPRMDKDAAKIISILKQNSNLSIREIAKQAKIPTTTVLRRIHALVRDGIITRYTIDVDMEKLGMPTVAFVLMNVDFGFFKNKNVSQNSIADMVAKHPNVEQCCTVTGRFDFLVKVRTKDISELDNFINYVRGLEGILRTETLISLYQAKDTKKSFMLETIDIKKKN